MKNHHFLLLTRPAQGHLNPNLQLAKRLASTGARVTFATTINGRNRLKSLRTFDGISYTFFSDGHDHAEPPKNGDFTTYMATAKTVVAREVTRMIQTFAEEGKPVTLLIYGFLLPWAALVARQLNVPSAFLVVQTATVFAIYHKYFDSRGSIYNGGCNIESSVSVKISNLPLFSSSDLPTFLLPTDQYFATSAYFNEHMKYLEDDPKPCVLINTFHNLEEASIKAIDNIQVIPIGPLIPSAFTDGNDPEDKSFGCDLFDSNRSDYLQWLDSKPPHSVIYVSFGSLAVLKKEQKVEILQGLLESGRSFLWIIRPSDDDEDEAVKASIQEGSSGKGIILSWCSQVEVLSHKSIGCFVSHCGWNSTLESLVAGVPIVGCPQFSDQATNAKMVEEVWGIGVRAGKTEGLVEREEIKRCLDILMEDGERGEEIRQNASKWRCLALEAIKEGGSSHNNLKMLLDSSYENTLYK
ncbi:hypothetical protein M9H77_30950 [Catharanthus roseus]|uniref:Uncharacterized protein n=1 Tax=Catharanthus roseus TaxID=4058 RepID=A0ACC0A112_CATRO|nr:hypothetical protein M9H77_30950 [Catharanthus roseus]